MIVRGVRLPFGRPQGRQADRDAKATTIDALFGPLTDIETEGRVWTYENNQLKALPVRLGISDGKTTELIEGDVQPDTALVTNITTGAETTKTAATTTPASPFRGLGGPGGRQGPRP